MGDIREGMTEEQMREYDLTEYIGDQVDELSLKAAVWCAHNLPPAKTTFAFEAAGGPITIDLTKMIQIQTDPEQFKKALDHDSTKGRLSSETKSASEPLRDV